ncbi:MAG TPA: hypothetical protein VLU25_05665 [Acidobacteriota bacterium]|nr:hypothetical protein [Acidobacteriota bacterium]
MMESRTATRAIVLLTLFLCGSSAQLLAQSSSRAFPHAVVGSAGDLESRIEVELSLVTEGNPALSQVKRGSTSASGTLKLRQQDGTPLSLRIVTENQPPATSSEIAYEFDFFQGPVRQRWVLESLTGSLQVFWIEIEQESGEVNGLLQFDFIRPSDDALLTSVPVPVVSSSEGNFVSVDNRGTRNTGLAFANPSGDTVLFWIIALDEDGEEIAARQGELSAFEQRAFFLPEFFEDSDAEILARIQELDGFVAVLAPRDISVVALRQNGIELATAPSISPNLLKVPYAFGQVEDFLGRDEEDLQDAMVRTGTMTLTPVAGESGKTAVALRGNSGVQSGPISPDGKFLIGPLEAGDWVLRVEADGFCPLEQTVTFPSSRLSLNLTNVGRVNVEWLSQTLQSTLRVNVGLDGVVIKPTRQFDFRFDGSAFGPETPADVRERIEAVRRAFLMWVWFELPQLRLPVLDEFDQAVVFGGRERYSEGASQASLNQLRVVADPETGQPVTSAVDLVSGEVRRATLRFDPEACSGEDCVLLPQLVSSVLWNVLFLRSTSSAGGEIDVGDFKISGLSEETESLAFQYTQISAQPRSMASTPVDNLYWAVLRQRPAGTLIMPDVEILPKRGSGR